MPTVVAFAGAFQNALVLYGSYMLAWSIVQLCQSFAAESRRWGRIAKICACAEVSQGTPEK